MSSVSKTSAELAGMVLPKPRGPAIDVSTYSMTGQAEHTVCQMRGDGERALLADAHALEALVPALDDLADTDYKTQYELSDTAAIVRDTYGAEARAVHGRSSSRTCCR